MELEGAPGLCGCGGRHYFTGAEAGGWPGCRSRSWEARH